MRVGADGQWIAPPVDDCTDRSTYHLVAGHECKTITLNILLWTVPEECNVSFFQRPLYWMFEHISIRWLSSSVIKTKPTSTNSDVTLLNKPKCLHSWGSPSTEERALSATETSQWPALHTATCIIDLRSPRHHDLFIQPHCNHQHLRNTGLKSRMWGIKTKLDTFLWQRTRLQEQLEEDWDDQLLVFF